MRTISGERHFHGLCRGGRARCAAGPADPWPRLGRVEALAGCHARAGGGRVPRDRPPTCAVSAGRKQRRPPTRPNSMRRTSRPSSPRSGSRARLSWASPWEPRSPGRSFARSARVSALTLGLRRAARDRGRTARGGRDAGPRRHAWSSGLRRRTGRGDLSNRLGGREPRCRRGLQGMARGDEPVRALPRLPLGIWCGIYRATVREAGLPVQVIAADADAFCDLDDMRAMAASIPGRAVRRSSGSAGTWPPSNSWTRSTPS